MKINPIAQHAKTVDFLLAAKLIVIEANGTQNLNVQP